MAQHDIGCRRCEPAGLGTGTNLANNRPCTWLYLPVVLLVTLHRGFVKGGLVALAANLVVLMLAIRPLGSLLVYEPRTFVPLILSITSTILASTIVAYLRRARLAAEQRHREDRDMLADVDRRIAAALERNEVMQVMAGLGYRPLEPHRSTFALLDALLERLSALSGTAVTNARLLAEVEALSASAAKLGQHDRARRSASHLGGTGRQPLASGSLRLRGLPGWTAHHSCGISRWGMDSRWPRSTSAQRALVGLGERTAVSR